MRTAPGRYTGQGADSWMDGSPAQGRRRNRLERDRRQQEAGTEPLRGHGRLHRHQAPRCPTALSGLSQPPEQFPRAFSDFPPRATSRPAVPVPHQKTEETLGRPRGTCLAGTGGHPLQARAPRKAWLCHNKVTTLINQPALIRGAPELRPNLTHHSCGSCGSLQRTFLLQQVTASLSPQALNTSLTNRVFSLQVTAQLTTEQGRTHKEPLLLLLLFKQMSNLRLTDHFLLSFSGAAASIWAPLLDSSCGSHHGCILQLLPPAFSCSSSARPSAPPSSQGPR